VADEYLGTGRERAYAGAACTSGEKMLAPRAMTSAKPTARWLALNRNIGDCVINIRGYFNILKHI
jgi:hypothetical protein